MRILPVANYQTQNKQSQSFGMIKVKEVNIEVDKPLLDDFAKRVLNGVMFREGSGFFMPEERFLLCISPVEKIKETFDRLKSIDITRSQVMKALADLDNAQKEGNPTEQLRVEILRRLGIIPQK